MANQYKNKVVYNGTTLIDISDTTAVQSDVASGKYFYTANGTKTLGTGSSSGNVSWETLWNGDVIFTYDSTENYPYCEISALGSTSILADSVWRITYANTEYICTAKTNGNFITIGNPKWGGGTDDGSDIPFVFYKTQAGAWGGEVNAPNEQSTYHFKIERQTASSSSSTLITKTITVNGTYSAQSDNADGYSEVTVNVSGGGSTPSATKHTIHFDFSDETDTDIDVYYDDALLATMIRAYTPTAYGQKTVTLAQLDGVTWYEPANIPLNTQLVDYNAVLIGYTIDSDGNIIESETYNCITDYILIDPTMTFSFKNEQYSEIGFYNTQKNPIGTVTADNIKESAEDYVASGYLTPSIIPLQAAYVVLKGNSYSIEETLSLIRTA